MTKPHGWIYTTLRDVTRPCVAAGKKVLDARRAAREELGRDPRQGNLFDAPPKKKSVRYVPLAPAPAEPRRDEAIGVLSLGEPAARLGVSRRELEQLIKVGKLQALPLAGVSIRVIPVREVEGMAHR